MDTVVVGHLDNGLPIHFDKHAFESDAVIVVNRIKSHTGFNGQIESGLQKMMVIGLGKHTGASTMHSYGVNHFNRLIPEVTRVLMKQTNVILGVGIIEDALEQVCDVCVIPIEDVLQREPELLKIAKEKMARIPFDSIDVLVIDEIGKDISGAGMDPNVTGRAPSGVLKDHCPRVQKIVVRDLTPNSHGNAVGIGMADVITKRVLEKIDFSSTYTNAITSTSLSAAKIPIVCPNDREALAVAVKTIKSEMWCKFVPQ